jgi:hypothetical protein
MMPIDPGLDNGVSTGVCAHGAGNCGGIGLGAATEARGGRPRLCGRVVKHMGADEPSASDVSLKDLSEAEFSRLSGLFTGSGSRRGAAFIVTPIGNR